MISCTPSFPSVSMEKAFADGICSNTFVCYNNHKKFCSTLCYPSVIARAAAKQAGKNGALARAADSVSPNTAKTTPASIPAPTYYESPDDTSTRKRRDDSCIPHHIRAALVPRCALADPDEILLHPPSFIFQHASRLQASMHRFRLFLLYTICHI